MIELTKINVNEHDFYIINKKAIQQFKSEFKTNKSLQLSASAEGYKQIGIELLSIIFYKNFEDWEIIKDTFAKVLLIATTCKETLEKYFDIKIKEIQFINYCDFRYSDIEKTYYVESLFKRCCICGKFTYSYHMDIPYYYKNHHCEYNYIKLKEMYEAFLRIKVKSKFATNKKKRQDLRKYPIEFPALAFELKRKQKERHDIAVINARKIKDKKQEEKEKIEQSKLNYIESFYDETNFNKINISKTDNKLKLYINTEDNYLISVINSYNIESPIEQILYEKLYKIKLFTVIPQYKVCDFIIDFVIQDNKGNNILAIECDGHDYHCEKEAMTRDYKRQRKLQLEGFTFMRFTGSEIYNTVCDCVNEIMQYYNKLKIN